MSRGRRGFALIELLVVIAIIGILAAMLFPAFARARESARKTQCLSNIKNIAMAYQMYISDWDRLIPGPHGYDLSYWVDRCGSDLLAERTQPYLKPPVLLDEYIKNWDVWRCPSAKQEQRASFAVYPVLNGQPVSMGEYWDCWMGQTHRVWPCDDSWPSGWAGKGLIDSNAQSMASTLDMHPFVSSITCNPARDLSMSQINDASQFVVVADGLYTKEFSPGLIIYPDLCHIDCLGESCANKTIEVLSSPDCDALACSANTTMRTNTEQLKPYTRHLGGSNVGFLDGHARWYSAGAFFAACPRWADGTPNSALVTRGLEGLTPKGPTSAAGTSTIPEGSHWMADKCGMIPLYEQVARRTDIVRMCPVSSRRLAEFLPGLRQPHENQA